MRKDSKWPKGSNQWYLLKPWPRQFSIPNAHSRGRSDEGRSHITRSAQFNRGGMTSERSMSNKCSERFSFFFFFFFLKSQLLCPTKNAPPLDSFVSGSCCHIQTHLILNTTSRMLPSTSSVPPTPSSVVKVWAS